MNVACYILWKATTRYYWDSNPDPTERKEICNRFPVAERLYFFDMLNDLFWRYVVF